MREVRKKQHVYILYDHHANRIVSVHTSEDAASLEAIRFMHKHFPNEPVSTFFSIVKKSVKGVYHTLFSDGKPCGLLTDTTI